MIAGPSVESTQSTSNAFWTAVLAIAIGAFALVITEFLPVGLLPPLARDVGIGEGRAGLMVTVPGVVAAMAALLMLDAARTADRRHVLTGLMAALVVSNAIVALAGSFRMLLLGRMLLGIAIGGFRAIDASLGPRLRAGEEEARATAIIFSGISLGTVAGQAPSSARWLAGARHSGFPGDSRCSSAWLPSCSCRRSGRRAVRGPARCRNSFVAAGIYIGIVALLLGIGGQFVAYTYIVPFLAGVTGIAGERLSATLLVYGVAGFAGNLLDGWAAAKTVRATYRTGLPRRCGRFLSFQRRRTMRLTVIACLASLIAVASPAQANPAANLRNARACLDMVMNKKQVRRAFGTYMGKTYIQHNPTVPTGVEGSVTALEAMVAVTPGLRYTFTRGAASGDLVFLHVHRTTGPGDRGQAVVDIFRFDRAGRIVEHWDVVQPVPETAVNSNTMF